MHQFIEKHQSEVVGVLSGWDRVRFRGTIRVLSTVRGLFSWMNEQHVLLKEFRGFAMALTERLKASVEAVAAAAGRSIEYLASSAISKEGLVEELLRREKVEQGVVCIFSCVEPCRSFDVRRDAVKKQLDLVSSLRKCLHWYLYFLHPVWGLCHVRIQSWLPFAVHVCINGREWLCRELTAEGIGFRRRDNCLIDVADVGQAQRFLDHQPGAPWTQQLEALLDRVCPALSQLMMRGYPLRHYWTAAETEWATDVMFRSPSALARLYPSLIRYGISTFSSPDVMRFLGRQQLPQAGGVYKRFVGEVVSDLKQRPEGVRIKHRMNANSIKMYDKQGSVLRVETTINNARDLRVYRASERDPQGPKKLRQMRKGVADLRRRAEVSQAANERYLQALAAVDTPSPLSQVVERLARPVTNDEGRVRGLHPLTGIDAAFVQHLLRGEFLWNGFRNRDLRTLMCGATDEPTQLRRHSAQVGRLLRIFRLHRLIYRVRGTHRYQLSANGRRVLPTILAARNADSARLHQLAT
jgi:hypothetical protein